MTNSEIEALKLLIKAFAIISKEHYKQYLVTETLKNVQLPSPIKYLPGVTELVGGINDGKIIKIPNIQVFRMPMPITPATYFYGNFLDTTTLTKTLDYELESNGKYYLIQKGE